MPQRPENEQGLTATEERFAQALARGFMDPTAPQTQADAYRAALPDTTASETSVWELASRMASDVKVRSRIIQLIDEANERTNDANAVTVESIRSELDEAKQDARASDNHGAVVRAIELKGKTIAAFKDVQVNDDDITEDQAIQAVLEDQEMRTKLLKALVSDPASRAILKAELLEDA